MELETSPDLHPWAWYTGAHQQYHIGFLLLLEIFAFPMRKEADRIWACLDYIFEVPSQLSRENKGRWIITQVRDKTAIYQGARKTRAPTGLTDQLRSRQPSPQDQKRQQQQASRFSSEKIQPLDSCSSPADRNGGHQHQHQQQFIPSPHEFPRQEVSATVGDAAYGQIQPSQLNHGQHPPPGVASHLALGDFHSKAASGGYFPLESVPTVPPMQPAAGDLVHDIDWVSFFSRPIRCVPSSPSFSPRPCGCKPIYLRADSSPFIIVRMGQALPRPLGAYRRGHNQHDGFGTSEHYFPARAVTSLICTKQLLISLNIFFYFLFG